MMRRTLVKTIVFLSFGIQLLYAQSADDRAKAYYFEAATSFEKKDYSKTIDYCQQVEDILGDSNARVEALRIKSYYELGDTQQAQKALSRFSTYDSDETLNREILTYLVRIEEAERERISKEQEEAEKIRQLIENAVFSEGKGLTLGENGKYGYIDEEGNVLIDFNFKDARPFNNGFAIVKGPYTDKFGMINSLGEKVIDYKYEILIDFDENGIACYQRPNEGSNKYTYPYAFGILDENGEEIGSFVSSEDSGQSRWSVYYNTAYYSILQNDNEYPYKNKINSIDLDKLWLIETLINSIPQNNEYYSHAQLEMARFHFYGRSNVIANFNKAFEYYSKVSGYEYIYTKYDFENIGDLYYNGFGTGQDKEKSLYYYQKMKEFYSLPYRCIAKYFINLIDLGQFDKAETEIVSAEQQITNESKFDKESLFNPTIFYSRAYLYDKMGDTKNALKWYKKADKNGYRIDYDKINQRIEELK